MNGRYRSFEVLTLGSCAFVLTQAILSLLLSPGNTPLEGNPVWKLILSVSYLSVTVILASYYRETLFVARRNLFLVALVGLALASCAWAATPELALRRSVAVLGTTLFGIALAVRLSIEDQLRLLSWLFRMIAVLSLACVFLLPSYGIASSEASQGEWQGIFSHKNELGSVMALSILVEWHLTAQTRFARFARWLALSVSALLLIFSGSLTPALAVVGSMTMVQIYRFAVLRFRIPFYATILGVIFTTFAAATLVATRTQSIAEVFGRSSDLTGRTEIWAFVIANILERPVWGYGYSGFWSGASPQSQMIDRAMGTMVMYSHNGYLEILLMLGLVGFLFSLGVLGTGIKRAFQWSGGSQSGIALWPLAFLVFFLLYNLGECTILLQNLEWSMCVATVTAADPALSTPDAGQEEELFPSPKEAF